VTPPNAAPEAPDVETAKEQKRMMDYETLERMPLESLLYYVLVGEGRKRESVEG
jgi:hypothetical protein